MNKLILTLLVAHLTFFFSMDTLAFPFATAVEVHGEVKVSQDEHNWQKLREGEELVEFSAIKVRDHSYLKLILNDNSLVRVGEDTYFSLLKKKSSIHINIGRGRLRVLSYKNRKVIETPQRKFSLHEGEFLVDVYKRNSLFKTDLTAYSGHLFYNDEVVLSQKYEPKPEEYNKYKYTQKEPYLYWFPTPVDGASYDIAINSPKKNVKMASRSIASIEEPVEPSVPLNDQVKIEGEKGEIWVHDVVFDEAVRVIEGLVYKEVQNLVPLAVTEVSGDLVWDVASKSIKRWGVYFAKEGEATQVPLAVKNSYDNQRKEDEKRKDFSYEYIQSHESSTKKIAEIRTYRHAKVLVETKAYEKAWRETHSYVMDLLPKIVSPLIVKEVHEKVVELAKAPVEKVIKQSDLVSNKEVDRLIRHISLLTSQRYTDEAVKKIGNRVAKEKAKAAVYQLSRSVSHDIATYMADKAGSRASSLVSSLFARKRARNIASGVADKSHEELYKLSRKGHRRKVFEAHR